MSVNHSFSQTETDSIQPQPPIADTTSVDEPVIENTNDSTTVDNTPVSSTKDESDSKIKRSDTLQGSKTDKVLTGFTRSEIELEKGSIVSNLLRVYNNSAEVIKFKVNIVYPGSWRSFNEPDEIFEVSPSDTLKIPIILIPNKLTNGNTEVLINAFVIDIDEQQIGDNYFSVRTKKHVSWHIEVSPSDNIYFKNGETIKDFEYTVSNTGNYKQDIFLSHDAYKGGLLITDTNHVALKELNKTVSLEANKDTTFKYKVSLVNDESRNYRKISIQNYIPNQALIYKRYTFYLNSSEPKITGNHGFHKGNKINFIRLPNETKASPYGYSSFPLIVEANAQNLLGNYAYMSVNMRGYKQIDDKSSITYNTRLNYSKAYYDNGFIKNAPFYVGYFRDSMSVEIGQLSGNIVGLSGYGKGIKGSYSYLGRHKTGAFYVRSPYLFQPARSQSFGLYHTYTHDDNFSATAKIGRQVNAFNGKNVTVATIQPKFNIQKKHYITLLGAFSRREETLSLISTTPILGFLTGANYTGHYLERRLRVNLNSRFNNQNFSFGNYERLNINQRTVFELDDKWDIYMFNSYNNINTINSAINSFSYRQRTIYNSLVFSTLRSIGTFQPGIYYNFSKFVGNRIHARGLSLRYSKYNYMKNFLGTAFFKAGYSLPVDIPGTKDYFTFEFSSIVRHKVWSVSTRYNYGVISSSSLQTRIFESLTPQTFMLSVQNQHQFKNPHFMLETNFMYNYRNTYKNHSLGVFPEFFYFNNLGWRFSIRTSYTLNSSNYSNNFLITTGPINTIEDPTVNQNLRFSATVRKEFGIPIPFIEKTSVDEVFVAFHDLNGNNIQDKDEPLIENVVIRLNNKIEVITNKAGEAKIKNVKIGDYSYDVFSLEDLSGWFPNVGDSIFIKDNGIMYVPFVRGVKVYGDVVVDRQKIAIAEDKKFDLSRIKISASNGKLYNTLTNSEGRFEFYLPNGDYVITLDENILGGKFKLSRNNIPVTLNSNQDAVYVSFYISEKRREVKVKDFGSGNSETDTEEE